MASTLFDLAAKITLDTSGYESGLNNAEGKMTSFASKIGTAGKVVASGIGTVMKLGAAAIGAVTVAAGAASTALYKGVREVAQYGDNIDKMSQKMNMSTDAYQEWDAVMQHCGTSIESLQTSMKTLANATEGNGEAFARLGISMDDIANMSNEELFSTTITALQNVENETERTYLAGKLLGRGATELGALLNLSADETQQLKNRVHELGGVMSKDAVKAAAQFQDNLQDLKTAIAGVKRSITAQFLPGFNDVLAGFTSLIIGEEGAEEQLTEGLDNILTTFQNMTPRLVEIIEGIGGALLKQVPTILKTMFSIGTELVNGISENAGPIIEAFVDTLSTVTPELTDGATKLLSSFGKAIVDNADSLLSVAGDVLDSFIGFLSDNSADFGDTAGKIITKLATALGDNASGIITGAVDIVVKLAEGFLSAENVAGYITAAGNIVSGIINAIPQTISTLAEGGETILDGLVKGAVKGAAYAAGEIIGALINAVKNMFGADNIWEILLNALNFAVNPLSAIQNKLIGALADEDTINSFLRGFNAGLNPEKTTTTKSEGVQGRRRTTDTEDQRAEQAAMRNGGDAIESTASDMEETVNGIKTYFDEIFTWVDEKFASFGELLNEKLWQPVQEFFTGIGEKIVEFVTPIGEGLASVWDNITSGVSDAFNKVVDILSPIGEALSELFAALGDLASAAWELIKQKVSDVAQSIGEKIGEIGSSVSEKVAPAFEAAGNIIATVWENIKTTVSNAVNTIASIVSSKFSEITSKIASAFESLKSKVTDVFNQIKSTITSFVSQAISWGEDLMRNLAQGIANGISWVTEKVKSVASTIWSYLHQSTAEVGPLSDTDKWTPDLMDNLINGIESKRGELERTIANVADTMNFRDAMTYSFADTNSSITAQNSEISGKLDALAEKIDALTDAILNQTWELDGEVVAENVDRRLGATAAMKARV